MKRLWLAGLAGLLAVCMTASAQDAPIKPENVVEVTTRDGKTISGRYRDKGDKVILDTADGEVEIPKADIASMKKGEEVPSPVVPAEPAKAPADEMPADETPADEMPADETPADEMPADETPADEMPADETPDEMPPAEMPPADEPPAEMPPADEPPADEPPADEPPADEPPADEPPADEPPADMPPADEPPADEPPADAPPADEPPADAPEATDPAPAEDEGEDDVFPAPAPDIEPAPAASQPTSEPAPADHDHHHATEVKSWYPEEEAEFGPIDVDYRGPVELSIFGGYRVYSSDLDVQKGGAFIGGARLTLNLFDDHRVGLDFSYSVTRINFNVDGDATISGAPRRTKLRGEVTINSFLVGATYRMDYLRLEYLTPYIRAGLGVNYFDSTKGRGLAFSTVGVPAIPYQEKIDSEFGLLVQLGTGFDYKLDRNWSLRIGTNVDAMVNDWADRDSPQFAANVEMGIVWHFQ